MNFDLLSELKPLLSGPITILDIGSAPEGRDRWDDLDFVEVYGVDGQDPDEPTFVGDGGQHMFYRTRWPGCSSILEPDPSVIDLFNYISATRPDGNFTVKETKRVETICIDDLDLPKIDMIKLDTQGSELMILQGGVDLLRSTLVVESEVEFMKLYRRQPLFTDVDLWLRGMGFGFHRFMDMGGRGLRPTTPSTLTSGWSQLLWADAVWLTTNIKSGEDAAKIALLMHYLYRGYDVAAFLMQYLKNDELLGRYLEWIHTEGESLM